MQDSMEYLTAPDPLWRHTPLPFRVNYAVMGVNLEVATNAPALAALAEQCFGVWRSDRKPHARVDAHLHLILHTESKGTGATAERLMCRMQGDYLCLNAGSSFGFVDRKAGFGVAFLTPDALTDPLRIQAEFIECPGLSLASYHRRATLHAAAVIYQDRCVLLTGESGAGKSTLAYACLRAGFGLLAEDMVFGAEIEPTPWVWGDPRFLHLLPDAVRFFPELEGAEAITRFNGEVKRRVVVRPEAGHRSMPVWGVCLLSRSSAPEARLLAADADQLMHALTHFQGDPPLDRAVMQQMVLRLLTGPTAHLQMGTDPNQAVGALRDWIVGECTPQGGAHSGRVPCTSE